MMNLIAAIEGSEIVGIVGIFGTLLGTSIGVLVTWKIQERRLAYESKTRFHQQRLQVYSKFLYLSNKYFSEFYSSNSISTTTRYEFMITFEQMRLVAPDAVVSATNEIHNILTQVGSGNVIDKKTTQTQFNSAVAKVIPLMREELSVAKRKPKGS